MLILQADWVHFTLCLDNITPYKTESVHSFGLRNAAAES